MAQKMTAAQALTAELKSIPADLRPPPEMYAQMLATAAKVRSAEQAAVIFQMLGDAASYQDDPPPAPPIKFPAAHLMHAGGGSEWYWLSANLTAQTPRGPARIGVLQSMERVRLISRRGANEAGWNDVEANVTWNAATVVVAYEDGSAIWRRAPNIGWSPLGDTVIFPEAGKPFHFGVGPDSLTCPTPDVMPLTVTTHDGDHLRLDLTMSSDMPADKSFFLETDSGITPGIAGVYYSWPQLKVSGTIVVEGTPYEVSGVGWVDHQSMQPPLPANPAGAPIPSGFHGWTWCQFNLDNGDAFTGAAFQNGALNVNPLLSFGSYLRRVGDAWLPARVLGAAALDGFIPTLNNVLQPTAWTFKAVNSPLEPNPLLPVSALITTAPWTQDGSFITGDLGTPSEVPASVALADRALGRMVTGAGYCESVDFEPRAAYLARAMAFLKSS